MGIVGPISAASPLVPLAVDATHGLVPAPCSGSASLSSSPGSSRSRSSPRGQGTGRLGRRPRARRGARLRPLFFVGLDAGADESAPWAVLAARAASVSIAAGTALLVTRTSLRPPRSLLPLLVAIGVFDTGANVLIAFASTREATGIVAVLGALYPIVTVVLARVVLGERLSAGRRAAGGVALAGAALVAAG